MKTLVVVNLQIAGLHNWPEAKTKAPEVGYLTDNHRHVFYITAKKRVSHDDRDIEIISMKQDMIEYFHNNYYNTNWKTHNFGSRSCETLAKDLAEAYDLDYCQVLEDQENGAEVWK